MEQNESGNKKTAKPKKIIIGILIACVAVLAILYAAGAFYFSSHFLKDKWSKLFWKDT